MYLPSPATAPCPSTDSACAAANSTSFQSQDTHASSSQLAHRNLVGLVVVAVVLVLGFLLWLFFGRWSKPIRHFFRCRIQRSKPNPVLPNIEWEKPDVSEVKVRPLLNQPSRSPSFYSEKPSIDYFEKAHVRDGAPAKRPCVGRPLSKF